MIQLVEHFKNKSSHSEWLRQQRWFVKARRDQERKEELADQMDDEFLSLATDVIMATQAQIKQFNTRLDSYEAKIDAYEANLNAYDTAIIKALNENQTKLDEVDKRLNKVEARLQGMRDHAYVIEDGRRVFKFKDGARVIDEFGGNVTRDEVDFDLVSGHHADTYLGDMAIRRNMLDTRAALSEDRNNLYQAQDELDAARDNLAEARGKLHAAREGIENEGLTVGEIEELEADLLDAMPASTLPTLPVSAMKHLSGVKNSATIPAAKDAFTANAAPAAALKTILPSPQFEPAG